MNRLVLIAILVTGLLLTSCRSDAAVPTTTPTTRAPLGVVIAACRLGEDTVTLLNQANSARNLNGWTIHDEGMQNVLDLGSVFIDHTKTMVFMSGPDAMLEANGRDEWPWPGAEDVWDDTATPPTSSTRKANSSTNATAHRNQPPAISNQSSAPVPIPSSLRVTGNGQRCRV